MVRCLALAAKAAGHVAPNPLVGAVLVFQNRIIGEGFHRQYGQAHAEVNCLQSVKDIDRPLIPHSTLYVSLEPCAHYGKTPPCADMIIRERIPKVVIGCRDPFKAVNGRGIEKLQQAGVEVETGVLETECKHINKPFFTFHLMDRPYFILKWAQTADAKMNARSKERLMITNPYSNRIVHRWRSESAAILVGTQTALQDDPELTNRYWEGPSPVRLVLDRDLRLPHTLKIFNPTVPTIIFNRQKDDLDRDAEFSFHSQEKEVRYARLKGEKPMLHELSDILYRLKIQSVLVEGGAQLLTSFLAEGLWDEARIITRSDLVVHQGLDAPVLKGALKFAEQKIMNDTIEYYQPETVNINIKSR
ncbi:MAG: bifunctional diaminohydroxyphosphoribosylaminopyrimidine deaminase/5-amino-6-(5-phosphoribosylamino)uracil reductase RibD [Terrimonas sp.]|nr:bifunctional diaminohydroxyphosphoribosylaminopyrimidine deaminase/5-amino-6-(5-phosphoribosylamino)uracil reductase RibD [Terrimonas sp.]